jgi:hypothetical protein
MIQAYERGKNYCVNEVTRQNGIPQARMRLVVAGVFPVYFFKVACHKAMTERKSQVSVT